MTTTTTRRRPKVEKRESVTIEEEVYEPSVSVRRVETKPVNVTTSEETIVTEIIEEHVSRPSVTVKEERIVVPSVEISEERRNVTIGVSQAEREALLIETEARDALRMNVTHEDKEVHVVREQRVE